MPVQLQAKRARVNARLKRESRPGQPTVVVLVGMPGAGKSLASSALKRLGIPVIVSGDVIREEAKTRGLEPTRQNLGRLMLRIREEEGMGAVARRIKPLIEKSYRNNSLVVYEGARNIEEIDELSRDYPVVTIAIHASSRTRFQRLLMRKRSDQPTNWKEFVERDERELKVGLARVIVLADRTIENEGTKEDLRGQFTRVLKTFKR